LQENVKDIIQVASVFRITEEQFIYAAVQNIIGKTKYYLFGGHLSGEKLPKKNMWYSIPE